MDLATALRIRDQKPRPGATTFLGWVQSSSSTTVTVKLADDTSSVTIPKLRGWSPINGDIALVIKTGGALYGIGSLNDGPVTEPPPDEGDDPPPTNPVRTATYRPYYTGTYRGSSWRSDTADVLQGDWTGKGLNYGAAYYGRGPSSLSGVAVSGTVRIMRASGGAPQARIPRIRLLQHSYKPSGSPTVATGVVLDGPRLLIHQSATVPLPVSWVQQLIDGQAGGIGLGIADNAYLGLLGRKWWAPSMELTLKYTKG